MKKYGVTLLELVIIVTLITILVMVAMPNYIKARVKAENNEMIAEMKLIRGAEDSVKLDTGAYVQALSNALINTNLRLSLPNGADRIWDYQVNSGGVICAQHRKDAARHWTLDIATQETPVAGACPY